MSAAVDLTGRTALVTGGSQGLGLAIAEALVRAGAGVCITGRTAETLEAAGARLRALARPGQVVDAVVADVASPDACTATVTRALDVLGGLTALVNNAGVFGPKGPVETLDWAEWMQAVQINLFGTVLMCREAIPHLRGRGYGKIVNLSGGGATAPMPGFSAYAASKAAVVRLTETFAEELRDAHVDVNAVAPGALNTRLLDEVLAAGPEKVGADFHARALRQQAEGGAPLAKGADLTAWLVSAQSDGITGRLLSAVWDDWASLADRRARLAKSDVYTLRRIVPGDREGRW